MVSCYGPLSSHDQTLFVLTLIRIAVVLAHVLLAMLILQLSSKYHFYSLLVARRSWTKAMMLQEDAKLFVLQVNAQNRNLSASSYISMSFAQYLHANMCAAVSGNMSSIRLHTILLTSTIEHCTVRADTGRVR